MSHPTMEASTLTAPDSEMAVIGAVLVAGDDYGAEALRSDDFADPRHAEIWGAITELRSESIGPDTAAVVERLKERGRPDLEAHVRDAEDRFGWTETPSYHVGIVRDRAVRRRLDAAGKSLREDAGRLNVPLSDVLDSAERRVFSLAEQGDGEKPSLVKSHLLGVIRLIEAGGYKGTPTGFYDLDRAMTGGGALPGQLIAVAGGTSMGKTAMGLGIAANMALSGHPVAYFSIEMTEEQNTLRLLAMEARADLKAMCDGTLHDHDMQNVAHAAGILNAAPLWLHKGATTLPDVRSYARRLKADVPNLAAVFVDHIHDMDHPADSRREQMGAIARGLKGLALDLGVAVFALAQLRRVEGRSGGPRPHLSDLKESGDIENSCDVALLLHRPEYYVSEEQAEEEGLKGKAECIVAKQRNGPTPSIPLTWLAHCARFDNIERGR